MLNVPLDFFNQLRRNIIADITPTRLPLRETPNIKGNQYIPIIQSILFAFG